jgi:hypothetical protein
MTHRRTTPGPGEYEVGYGKPPSRTKFRKGTSGNPGGRPRGMTAGRANRLALSEAYRLVTVREGDKIRTVPALQAVLRALVALAAKGNGPAQRTVFETIQGIERELAAQEHTGKDGKPIRQEGRFVGNELARRIAFLLRVAGNTEP